MATLHGADPIANGYVAMGWPELGDLSKIEGSRDAFKARYATANPGAKLGNIQASAGQPFRFLHEMKSGDLIIYPSKQDRLVNIGVIDGDYQYAPIANPQYPNRRPVRWLKAIQRDAFSQNALYEIGSALTLFRVTSHSDEFLNALTGEPKIADRPDVQKLFGAIERE